MKMILQSWNLMRIVRLVLGIAIIVQGITAKDTISVVLGVFLGGTAIAGIGCCGTNGCAISGRSTDKTQRIDYEELDNTK